MLLKNKAIFFLFVLILIEGYVVLSSELLAIRLTIPFIGSGTDTVSIIIAAVLMPLAFGYYNGGKFKPYRSKGGKIITIRQKLISNITISLFFIVFGLSYVVMTLFFETLKDAGSQIRLINIALYSAIFLVIPVYLLGQTIPLISNYFSKQILSRITGKMLFFSTMGSFLGAVFSTLVLMATIGVHYTVAINILLLAGLYFLIEKKFNPKRAFPIIIVTIIGLWLNSGAMMRSQDIVDNNVYNTIKIIEQPRIGRTIMSLNNNFSSGIGPNDRPFKYAEFIQKRFTNRIPADAPPKDILVIGAGGFTLGIQDAKNNYDYVDIDGSLKEISEEYFLKRKLRKNNIFYPLPARAYLNQSDKKYDLILVDAFQGSTSVPEHLVTQEFYSQVRGALKPNGIFIQNMIADVNFNTDFSRNLDSTLRTVFPYLSRETIQPYDGWNFDDEKMYNVIYSGRKVDNTKPLNVYTDNKNTIFYDKPLK